MVAGVVAIGPADQRRSASPLPGARARRDCRRRSPAASTMPTPITARASARSTAWWSRPRRSAPRAASGLSRCWISTCTTATAPPRCAASGRGSSTAPSTATTTTRTRRTGRRDPAARGRTEPRVASRSRTAAGGPSSWRRWRAAIAAILAWGRPDLVLYQAGADPYREDPYSPLDLDHDDLRERDREVFAWAKREGLPLAWVLAGGYTPDISKVVGVHLGTFAAARILY